LIVCGVAIIGNPKFLQEVRMFEFFGAIAEALSGYITGRFRSNKKFSFHLSAILISLSIGFIFFATYGLYELIYPASNPMGDIWLGLVFFSTGVSLIAYLMILITGWVERCRKLKKNGR
jgi:hypothetical protein